MIGKVMFDMTLFDDSCVKAKLDIMSKLEAMFDDARNYVPNEYYDIVGNIELGDTIRITVEKV